MEKPQFQGEWRMLPQLRGMIECRDTCENRLENNTHLSLHLRAVLAVFLLLALGWPGSLASAQGLDPEVLLKSPTDAWPTYNGDYSGRRFSTLEDRKSTRLNSSHRCI